MCGFVICRLVNLRNLRICYLLTFKKVGMPTFCLSRCFVGTTVVGPSCTSDHFSVYAIWRSIYPESVATLPPFSPIEGQKWFDQISSQWESQKNRFALIYFGKIQFLSPVHVHRLRGGIQERTVGLRFLGIISRVLRLEVSTLVFCFLQTATHEQTWVFFIGWLFCMDFWNHRGSMVFCQVFLPCLHL